MAEKNKFDKQVENFTYKPLQNPKFDDFSDVENWIKKLSFGCKRFKRFFFLCGDFRSV